MPAETVMRTILIIDDNIATRYAMRRVLERQAWRVLEAGMGADGLALLATNDVDVLVLDVNLPDMSGFDVVHTLREILEQTRHHLGGNADAGVVHRETRPALVLAHGRDPHGAVGRELQCV